MRLNSILLIAVIGCAGAQPKPSPQPAAPPPPAPVVAAPEPPPAPVVEAPTTGIPAALPMTDSSMIAVLRIKEPLDLAHRLGLSNAALSQKLLPGFNPADVHPGTAALFIWEPAAGAGQVPSLVGLLPAAADSAFSRHLQSSFKGLQLAPLGKDTLGAMDPALLSKKLKDGPLLQALARTPSRDDITLDVNLVAFLARYGAPMRELLERTQAQMQAKSQEGMNTGKPLSAFIDGLASYATLTFGARILPQDFRFSLVTREKTPPPEAAPKPLPAVEAVRYLPAGSFRMQVSGRFLEKTLSFSQSFYSGLVSGVPSLSKLVEESLADQATLVKDLRQAAFTFSLSPEKYFHILYIADSSDPKAVSDVLNRGMMRMSDPTVQKDLAKSNLACSTRSRKAVRKIEGVPVDKLEMNCKPKGKVTPEVARFVRKLYPMTIETVLIGDFLVTEINASGAGDLPAIVHDVRAQAPSGPPLAANTVFPEPGFLHSDLDVARLFKEINQVAQSEKSKFELPEIDPSTPPIVVDGHEDSGATEYRGQIAKSAAQALGDAMRQLQQAAQQGP